MALQAVGNFRVCSGFQRLMVSMGRAGQISVVVAGGACVGVVISQTSGAICVGRLVSKAFVTFTEQWAVISDRLLVYRAVMQLGGLASGWYGEVILQN